MTFRGHHDILPRVNLDVTPLPAPCPPPAADEGGLQMTKSGTVHNSNREEVAQHPTGELPQHFYAEEHAHNPSNGEHQNHQSSPAADQENGLKHHKGWVWEEITKESIKLPRASCQCRPPSQYTSTKTNRTLSSALIAKAHKTTSLPKTLREAHQSAEWPKWEKAIKIELSKMARYKVWSNIHLSLIHI